MNAPTAADIQGWTNQPDLKAADSTVAARTVARAIAMFKRFTYLNDFTQIDPEVQPLVEQAIQGLAELFTVQQSADYMETLADFDLLQSFSAGAYSETRRSPEDAQKARLLVAWPWLSELLWSLMTPDAYDYWWQIITGNAVPAFDVQEVAWGEGRPPYVNNPWDVRDEPYFYWDR
jgi:hypothetical protein